MVLRVGIWSHHMDFGGIHVDHGSRRGCGAEGYGKCLSEMTTGSMKSLKEDFPHTGPQADTNMSTVA